MSLKMILIVLAGSLLGGLFGYFNQCTTGTCSLTATWWRGAIYGGVLGLLIAIFYGGAGSKEMNQSSANVKHIAETEFDAEVLKATTPVVVDFYATWCGPCKMLAPVLDQQAAAFTGKIKFLKVNVDEASDLSKRFQIQSIPTLLFFKDGKQVDSSVGLISADALRNRLQSLIPATSDLSKSGILMGIHPQV